MSSSKIPVAARAARHSISPARLVAHEKFLLWTSALASVLALASCDPPTNRVRLVAGPTPDSIAFRLSGPDTTSAATGVYGLSVVRCDGTDPQWIIGADGSRNMPDVVVYGRTIPGFPARVAAMPLAPGCYRVLVSGARALRIHLDAHGVVTVAP